MTHGTRAAVVTVTATALTLLLGACDGHGTAGASNNGKSTDGFAIINESDAAVTATVLGTDTGLTVEAGGREVIPMEDCLGTGISISDDAGSIYEYEGRICVAEVLRVTQDRRAGIEDMFG